MTGQTTTFALVNQTGSANAYAYITGLDLNNNNSPIFVQADGATVYRPVSPSSTLQPLAADVAISLGSPGSTRNVTVPRIAGGRVWFVIGARLTFLLNPGPAIVEPSVTNPSDKNYSLNWGFCEFTFNADQLFVNISYVDFVALPIALNLRNRQGRQQVVRGLPPGGLDAVVAKLEQQQAKDNAGWAQLVVKAADGSNLRALSPNSARVMNNALFQGYYQAYVDQVWAKYTSQDLTINTQAQWGNQTGRVAPSTGLLTFPGIGTFAKPTAGDIFTCSTGPFGSYPDATRDAMGNLGARIAASLNRTTLLANPQQPDGEKVSSYYAGVAATGAAAGVANHYSRILHEVNLDGRGYAFPYDDVVPSGTGQPEQAGTAFDGDPDVLTITLGSLKAAGAAAGAREAEVATERGDVGTEAGKVVDPGDAGQQAPDGQQRKQELRRRSLKARIGSVTSRMKKVLA
ncbi:glucanase B [Microdochium trichocladiopsis]|uniref:Glucanase B n=1 Tax=Microdochium trichocladiopsis TaxID=1682393 RepID=A0A9P8YKQ0_9PEZI|nr:glucanase B [Microdochium trichocladiopsis]KAH7041281.1 glucanase B [Microdochium trichocladiopsis]